MTSIVQLPLQGHLQCFHHHGSQHLHAMLLTTPPVFISISFLTLGSPGCPGSVHSFDCVDSPGWQGSAHPLFFFPPLWRKYTCCVPSRLFWHTQSYSVCVPKRKCNLSRINGFNFTVLLMGDISTRLLQGMMNWFGISHHVWFKRSRSVFHFSSPLITNP